MFNLAVLRQSQDSTDPQVHALYQASADLENAAALHNLGVMYATGSGLAQDEAQALHHYRQAAQRGDVAAQ